MHLRIDLNEPRIREKVTNDRFGRFVAYEWSRLLDPYTPRETGHLMSTVWIEPWEITYGVPYAAYQYNGEIYVDPKTGAGGFLTDEGWKSRRGVKKVRSGRPLKYQKENPYSTDHWDEKAAKAGQLDKLYRTLNDGLSSGQF